MADKMPLTDRQTEIMDFIADFTAQRGYPPTNREIGKAFGIKSPNAVEGHLKALERKGAIVRDRMKARSIRIVAGASRQDRPAETVALRSLLDECDEYLEADDRECVADLRRRIAALLAAETRHGAELVVVPEGRRP